ncbi:MAG: DUF4428 domain-containing protein [Firmicutes bacterium]|nr:DUF4428 domain-containing protein [Bacillota bacterium]
MAKKECDICGGKIGLLGNRKLDDGNCCKDCANKLSPWMTGRRKTGVEDIKAHLAYREENRRLVQQFNPSSIAGENWKVFVDPNMGAFAVSRGSNFRADNPDIIPLSQVVSCEVERQEHRHEVYQQMPDGTKKSYFPARYDYTYDFEVNIQLSSPWFNEIKFQLNGMTIKDRYDPRYRQCEAEGDQIRAMLLSGQRGGMGMPGQFQQPMQQGFQQPMQQQFQQQPMQQPAAPANWFCQNCGTQNAGNFCQGCGAKR